MSHLENQKTETPPRQAATPKTIYRRDDENEMNMKQHSNCNAIYCHIKATLYRIAPWLFFMGALHG